MRMRSQQSATQRNAVACGTPRLRSLCQYAWASGSRMTLTRAPVIHRLPEALMAAAAHHHRATFSALLGDGRDACERAGPLVVSRTKRLCGLPEHRGGGPHPEPRQGSENHHVTMLALLLGNEESGA